MFKGKLSGQGSSHIKDSRHSSATIELLSSCEDLRDLTRAGLTVLSAGGERLTSDPHMVRIADILALPASAAEMLKQRVATQVQHTDSQSETVTDSHRVPGDNLGATQWFTRQQVKAVHMDDAYKQAIDYAFRLRPRLNGGYGEQFGNASRSGIRL